MSAMNIDRALEVLERELAIFEKNQSQERPEETSADQATLEKYTELWRRLRSDMKMRNLPRLWISRTPTTKSLTIIISHRS